MKTALALAIVCVLMGTMSANPVENPVEGPAEDPAMERLMKIERDLEGLKETIEELGEPKEDPMETQEGGEVAMEKRGGKNTWCSDSGHHKEKSCYWCPWERKCLPTGCWWVNHKAKWCNGECAWRGKRGCVKNH